MAGAVTDTWKKCEKEIAALLGGKRRGASFIHEKTDGTHEIVGNTDVILDGFAVEVKHSRRPTWALIRGALTQAGENKTHSADLPVAIIHKERDRYDDSLVIISIETFKALINK